jgi:hypothetical protein
MTTKSDLAMPTPDDHETTWQQIKQWVHTSHQRQIEDIFTDFFQAPVAIQSYPLGGLHHVAVYLGDYTREREVDAWHAFLTEKQAAEPMTIDRGPSYIAPKCYGTPGWWFSVSRPGGPAMEMFCNRFYGGWSRYTRVKRSRLMAHMAVSVQKERDLSVLLDEFAAMAHIEMIAFTPKDELGHTYGHLRNNNNHKVLELIFSDESAVDDATG